MYAITTEDGRRLVRIVLSGFFAPEEVATFTRDLRAAAIAVGCAEGGHRVLVDTQACALQTQEVVGAFRQLIATAPYPAARIALVTGNSISRMQARRLLVDDRLRMFDCADEAVYWLVGAVRPLARAPARPVVTPLRY